MKTTIMGISQIELDKLNYNDTYTLLLYAVYKLKDIPEYSTLSELFFILDKDSVLKLLEYYGGKTITIPTVNELKIITRALILYRDVHINNMDIEDSKTSIFWKHISPKDREKILEVYEKLSRILISYE